MTDQVTTQGPAGGTTGDDGEPHAYGHVVLDDWVARLERHRHPLDGSLLLTATTPAASAHETPIVLLHGIGNDGATFAPVLAPLADRRPVFAPRLNASLLTFDDDPAAVVDGMVHFLAAVTPPPWQIVGHSMGGVLTGLLLRARPDLVSGAVLLNSPLPGVSRRFREGDTLDRTGRALLALKVLAQISALGRPRVPRFLGGFEIAVVRNALRGFVNEPDAIDDEVMRRAIIWSRTRDGDEFLRLARKLPEWELAPTTAAPVYVVAGTDDPLVSPGDLDLISLAYPEAWFVLLDGVAHFAHLEAPTATVSTIDNAFSTLADARAGRLRLPRWQRRSVV